MAEESIIRVLLYAAGDVLFALLAALVLAVPVGVPLALWWFRAGSSAAEPE